jgi:hypothetical protein
MQKILKFPLSTSDVQTLEIPVDAKILCVKVQHGHPCAWVMLDPLAPTALRHITLYSTGRIVPERIGRYIDTILMHEDRLVLHVFEDC